jgi:hypothetical protein
VRIRHVLACAVLLAACRDDARDRVEEAAEEVADTRDDQELTTIDRGAAEVEFVTRRTQAVTALRTQLAHYDALATIGGNSFGTLADDLGRQWAAADRLTTFRRELGEAEAAIDSLATATVDQWEPAYDTVENAFQQLRTASDELYKAIGGTDVAEEAPPMPSEY